MRLKSDFLDSVENYSSLVNVIHSVKCRLIFWSVTLIWNSNLYDEHLTEWNKISVNFNMTTRRQILEFVILHNHLRENLKSHVSS
jgi:hypothetical protein